LKQRLGEIVDLRRATSVLYWDQLVLMPDSGNAARGTQLATLESLVRIVSSTTGSASSSTSSGRMRSRCRTTPTTRA
jgi:Zn-dependent M32 family carboxypeptidase